MKTIDIDKYSQHFKLFNFDISNSFENAPNFIDSDYSSSHFVWLNDTQVMFRKNNKLNVTNQIHKFSNYEITKIRVFENQTIALTSSNQLLIDSIFISENKSSKYNHPLKLDVIDFETDGNSVVIIYKNRKAYIKGRLYDKWTLISTKATAVYFSNYHIHILEDEDNKVLNRFYHDDNFIFERIDNGIRLLKYIGRHKLIEINKYTIKDKEIISIESDIFKQNKFVEELILDFKSIDVQNMNFIGLPNLKYIEMLNVEIPLDVKLIDIPNLRNISCKNEKNIKFTEILNASKNIYKSEDIQIEKIIINEEKLESWFLCNIKNLKEITLSENVKEISNFAISNQKNLEQLSIKLSHIRFLNNLVSNCPKLKRIYIKNNIEIEIDEMFNSTQDYFLSDEITFFNIESETVSVNNDTLIKAFFDKKTTDDKKYKYFFNLYQLNPLYPYNNEFIDKYLDLSFRNIIESDNSESIQVYLNQFKIFISDKTVSELINLSKEKKAISCIASLIAFQNSKNYTREDFTL